MPEQTAYSLTLARTASPLPARMAAFVGALLAAIVLGVYALPSLPAVGRESALISGVSLIDAPAAVERATGNLISETSSTLAQTVSAGPALSASGEKAAGATAAASDFPGQRWQAEGFVFVLEGQEWDANSFTSVDSALARLPDRIRAQLGNRALGDVSIMVNSSGRMFSGKQPYGGPANFFSTNEGRNELVLFPGQSVLTVLHELGHAYNLRGTAAGRYATVLLEPEMQSFMTTAGWRVLSTPEQVRSARDHLQVQMVHDGSGIWPRLSNNDPLEDFANSFALYFFSPEELKVKSPERFDWFEAFVGR